MTLSQWLTSVASFRFDPFSAINVINGAVHVPDCRDVETSRTWLYGLEDYRVVSMTGGCHVLLPRSDDLQQPLCIVVCADCGRHHDANALPTHECKQQRRANRQAKRGKL